MFSFPPLVFTQSCTKFCWKGIRKQRLEKTFNKHNKSYLIKFALISLRHPLLLLLSRSSYWVSELKGKQNISDLHTRITYVESSKWKTWGTLILKLLFLFLYLTLRETPKRGPIWEMCHGEAEGVQSINAWDKHCVCGRCRHVSAKTFQLHSRLHMKQLPGLW